MLITEKYMQIGFKLPSNKAYGFGERKGQLRLIDGVYTMWTSGQPVETDFGTGDKQGSGVHPFLLVPSGDDGQFIGILFDNSQPMSPILVGDQLTYISTNNRL